jgi:phage N-6-adenine-methyltransferase
MSSERDDWLTPYDILDRACSWMGSIDLDPCSDGSHVPARVHYTKEMNGLVQSWVRPDGLPSMVFMNPPYNKRQDQRKFVRKVLDEFDQGHIVHATLLLAARTDTQWHSWLARFPRCYVRGRLKFLDPHTEKPMENGAPFPSVVFGLTRANYRHQLFEAAFRPLGDVFELFRP